MFGLAMLLQSSFRVECPGNKNNQKRKVNHNPTKSNKYMLWVLLKAYLLQLLQESPPDLGVLASLLGVFPPFLG